MSKWGCKYRYATNSWETNWEHLSEFFSFSEEIRKVMYTTNIVEGYHCQFRKATKTKGSYPSDDALLRHIFLVYRMVLPILRQVLTLFYYCFSYSLLERGVGVPPLLSPTESFNFCFRLQFDLGIFSRGI